VIAVRTLVAADGCELEAELAAPDRHARAGMVLCHPHPRFGGSMRSIVIGALFDLMPSHGVACLRFNFRGVGASGGTHDEGRAEQLDVTAAVAELCREIGTRVPCVLAGWSFGADMALATHDDRVDAWFAVAPPLRFASDFSATAADPRPKLLALGEHDEYRSPASVQEEVASWTATDTVVIPGASHFFIGRTDRVVDVARGYVDRLDAARRRRTAPTPPQGPPPGTLPLR
jgi:alpha/beta superfamily hydrolase